MATILVERKAAAALVAVWRCEAERGTPGLLHYRLLLHNATAARQAVTNL